MSNKKNFKTSNGDKIHIPHIPLTDKDNAAYVRGYRKALMDTASDDFKDDGELQELSDKFPEWIVDHVNDPQVSDKITIADEYGIIMHLNGHTPDYHLPN